MGGRPIPPPLCGIHGLVQRPAPGHTVLFFCLKTLSNGHLLVPHCPFAGPHCPCAFSCSPVQSHPHPSKHTRPAPALPRHSGAPHTPAAVHASLGAPTATPPCSTCASPPNGQMGRGLVRFGAGVVRTGGGGGLVKCGGGGGCTHQLPCVWMCNCVCDVLVGFL